MVLSYQYESSQDETRKRYGDYAEAEVDVEVSKRSRAGATDGIHYATSGDSSSSVESRGVSSTEGGDPLRSFKTRLIISQEDLPKIVGLGGQVINAIRDKTGGHVKAVDLPSSAEEKMIVLGGYVRQVVEAFDLVIEKLFSACVNQNPPPLCSVSLLIEDNKAGKIVGQKAATVVAIKTKSGASQIRMLKPTLDMGGSLFRSLIIEGTLISISRAHALIQDLFVEGNSTKVVSGTVGGSSLDASMLLLSNRNVPYDAAMKFQELHHYLRNQFGLSLLVSSFQAEDFYARTVATESLTLSGEKEHRCEFPIPKENAGLIIGKGGENLKALEEQFRMHIHVEKIPTADNKRTVVIIGEHLESVLRAKEKILFLAGVGAPH